MWKQTETVLDSHNQRTCNPSGWKLAPLRNKGMNTCLKVQPCRGKAKSKDWHFKRKRFVHYCNTWKSNNCHSTNASRHCWSKWSPYDFYSVSTTADGKERTLVTQWYRSLVAQVVEASRTAVEKAEQAGTTTSKADEKQLPCNVVSRSPPWLIAAGLMAATVAAYGLTKAKRRLIPSISDTKSENLCFYARINQHTLLKDNIYCLV